MAESMNDYLEELEKSYSLMGDGVHDTDELLSWQKAQELLESKEPVTMTISEVKRGGVIVDFENIKGFIPISRISLERIEDLKPYLYQEITAQVIEVNMEEDKLVFSARELLKKKADEEKAAQARLVVPGMVLEGKVATIKEYGAFINLDGGLSGLVHISQITDKRIKHPGVVLKEGQEVTVKVLDVKDGKISLSMKALLENDEEDNGSSDNSSSSAESGSDYTLPETESIGTSLGDLLKGFKFD